MAAGAASGAGGAGAAEAAGNQAAAETARLSAANQAAATTSPTFMGNLSQAGEGAKNLFSGQEGSFDAFIGSAEREANARKGIEAAEATGLGGGVGAFKTAGALGAPMIMDALTPEYPTAAPAEEESSNYEGPYTPTERRVSYPDDERRRRSSEFTYFSPSNPVPFDAGGKVEEDRSIKMPDANYIAGQMPEFSHNFKPVEVVAPTSPPTVAINLGGGGGGKGGIIQKMAEGVGQIVKKDKKTESQTSDLSNYRYDPKTQRLVPNFASGGVPMLEDGGFVLTKKAVDGLGKGSNKKGQQVASRGLGAIPIKGAGAKRGPKAGVDDKIKTSIEGKQPALVSNGEAYVPKRQVAKHGGAKKFYALMKKAERRA